jgi:hypothetical protein
MEDKEMTEAALFSDIAAGAAQPGIPANHSVVRLADGSLVVVANDEIKSLNAAAAAQPEEPEAEAEYYLWLADGSVERVKESEVPGHAGTNALHGYFKRDGSNFVIVGVYPTESKA